MSNQVLAGVPAAATALDTPAEWLADKKPLFFEKGLQVLWSELNAMFAVSVTLNPGTFGAATGVTSTTIAVGKTPRTGAYGLDGGIVAPPTQFR